MFWLYVSTLTPSGSGRLEWQSRQEFLVCADSSVPTQNIQATTTSTTLRLHFLNLRYLFMQPHFATQPYTVMATMYPRKTQANPEIQRRVRKGFSRSRNGNSRAAAPTKPKARMPSISPSMPRIFEGIILSVWNMNRKYHSGLMPAGAEPNGSAFTPRLHGNSAASAPSSPSATYHAINSRNTKLGKKRISLLAAGLASHCASTPGGTLMPKY